MKNDIKKKFIDYHYNRIQDDLKDCIDLLCDLTIEPDILDVIHLLECILEMRTLNKVIKDFEKDGNLYEK